MAKLTPQELIKGWSDYERHLYQTYFGSDLEKLIEYAQEVEDAESADPADYSGLGGKAAIAWLLIRLDQARGWLAESMS